MRIKHAEHENSAAEMLYLISVTLLLRSIPFQNNFPVSRNTLDDFIPRQKFIFTVRSSLDDNKSQDIKFPSKPIRSEIEFTHLSNKV